jgi:hypothetical protein
MQFKSVFIILSGLFVIQTGLVLTPVLAKELGPPPIPSVTFCIKNRDDYNLRKEQLPEVLKGIEKKPNGRMYRLSGMKRIAAKAAMKLIIADNGKFIFDAGVAAPGKLFYVEDSYISQMCFHEDEMEIELENKTTYKATINDESSFDLEGGTFKPTTEAEFAQEIEDIKTKIEKKNPGATSKPATSGTAKQSGKN